MNNAESDAKHLPAKKKSFTLTGIYIHFSLWILILTLILFLNRENVFLRHQSITYIILLSLSFLAACFWLGQGFRQIALAALNAFSILLMVAVLYEVVKSNAKFLETENTRFPYPYRMHGFAPEVKVAMRNKLGQDYTITTNDTGLRHSESISRKAEGEFRILVVGSSTMLGIGSNDDQTPTAELEKILKKNPALLSRPGIKKVSVINSGQGWYNSTQELIFLITELVLYEPDLIVVIDGYNDVHHMVVWQNRPPANEVTSNFLASFINVPGFERDITWGDAFQTLLRSSVLFHRTNLLPESVIQSSQAKGSNPSTVRLNPESKEFIYSVKHRLIMNWVLMNNIAESFNCPILFSLQPAIYSKKNLSDEELAFQKETSYTADMTKAWQAVQVFTAAEVKRLNLPYFEAAAHIVSNPERLFTDYCHLVPKANQLIAQAVSESLPGVIEKHKKKVNWSGVRYPFDIGDPFWRPNALSESKKWQ